MTIGIVDSITYFLENLIKNFVDYPNDVIVNGTSTTKSIVVQIKCNPKDIGKIIGKCGRNIDSLKILTSAVKNTKYSNDRKEIFINILEDENSNFSY